MLKFVKSFVMLITVVYLYSDNNNIKTNTMTTFNNTLTIEEATKLFKFKGQAMYPKTKHNMQMMALVIDKYLKSIR